MKKLLYGVLVCLFTFVTLYSSTSRNYSFTKNIALESELDNIYYTLDQLAPSIIKLNAGGKFYVDSGSDTYIYQKQANEIAIVAGDVEALTISDSWIRAILGTGFTIGTSSLSINAGVKFYLDGGNDTYITQSGTDNIAFYGADSLLFQTNTTGSYFPNNIQTNSGVGLKFTWDTSGGNNSWWETGTTNPYQMLFYVEGANIMTLQNGYVFIDIVSVGDSATSKFLADSTNGSSQSTLYIGNTAIQMVSDLRLKENIVTSTMSATNLLNQIRVVDFDWKHQPDVEDPDPIKAKTDRKFKLTNNDSRFGRGQWTGTIAQEVANIIPYAVNKNDGENCKDCRNGIDDEHEVWRVDYGYLVPVLIKSIQELSDQIDILQK